MSAWLEKKPKKARNSQLIQTALFFGHLAVYARVQLEVRSSVKPFLDDVF